MTTYICVLSLHESICKDICHSFYNKTLVFCALYLEDESPDGNGHVINQSITSQSESSLLSTLIPGTLT